MKYDILNYDEAHSLVARNRFLRWDGYDIVTFKPNPKGFIDRRGQYRKGVWGIEFRYPLKDNGTWSVPESYARSV